MAIAPLPGERLVEVGPGRGALTWSLLARAKDMDVIEIDRDLARLLSRRLRAPRRICAFMSRTSSTPISRACGADGPPLRIVGNLPYNISTPLLFRLLSSAPPSATCTSCCRKRWWIAWPPNPAARSTAD